MTDRLTDACPSCESARSVHKRKEKKPTYICHECGHEFEEPERRQPRNGIEAGRGSPLVDLDPEEVP